MSKQTTMKFWRDKYKGPGCLEYSWVPEGRRRYINLQPGMEQGSSTDIIDDSLEPSNVQVYIASSNGEVSIEMWHFPAVARKNSPIVSALVLIFEGAGLIVGTAYYADGTVTSELAKLDRQGRVCPEEQSA